MLFLATHPKVTPDHLSSVDSILVGAAAASLQLQEKFRQKCGRDVDIAQGYGMTESSPVTLCTTYKYDQSKVGTCGKLYPNTQAKIVSLTDGSNQGPHQTGELYVRGPQIMKGYLKNEKTTRETVDEDGWLHTGDVAYYDQDGFFFIVDRTKELIKVKGNQVRVPSGWHLLFNAHVQLSLNVYGVCFSKILTAGSLIQFFFAFVSVSGLAAAVLNLSNIKSTTSTVCVCVYLYICLCVFSTDPLVLRSTRPRPSRCRRV